MTNTPRVPSPDICDPFSGSGGFSIGKNKSTAPATTNPAPREAQAPQGPAGGPHLPARPPGSVPRLEAGLPAKPFHYECPFSGLVNRTAAAGVEAEPVRDPSSAETWVLDSPLCMSRIGSIAHPASQPEPLRSAAGDDAAGLPSVRVSLSAEFRTRYPAAPHARKRTPPRLDMNGDVDILHLVGTEVRRQRRASFQANKSQKYGGNLKKT